MENWPIYLKNLTLDHMNVYNMNVNIFVVKSKPLMNTTLREAETVISAFDYKMWFYKNCKMYRQDKYLLFSSNQ